MCVCMYNGRSEHLQTYQMTPTVSECLCPNWKHNSGSPVTGAKWSASALHNPVYLTPQAPKDHTHGRPHHPEETT